MKILITGGAGFIGSNLAEAFLADERVSSVRVMDNFATGFRRNVEPFLQNTNFELFEGDIRNFSDCQLAMKDIDLVTHQAALGSVPRSVEDPLTTNDVNITGSLNILHAAKEAGIKRMVFAASSSTYGDNPILPKKEENIGNPLSPYAVTKYVNELYANVFNQVYGINYIGLRYFNVFGPRQDPHGAYAAVIPLFFKAAQDNVAPIIHGDGEQSRDFTFVSNAVQANMRGLFTDNPKALNQIYNVACGERATINELWNTIKTLSNATAEATHVESRAGDVKHSLADITKARNLLGYEPEVNLREGLTKTYQWFQKNNVVTIANNR